MRRTVSFVMVMCVLGSVCSCGPRPSAGPSPGARAPSPDPRPSGPNPESTKKELEKLQGTWICVEQESEGRHKKNAEEFQNRLTISGKDMTEVIKATNQTFRGTIKLDLGHQPKRLVFHILQPVKEQAKKAYEVSGDTLRVASFVLDQNNFPPDISGKGENRQVEIYQRKK